jgi:hypothetical protein
MGDGVWFRPYELRVTGYGGELEFCVNGLQHLRWLRQTNICDPGCRISHRNIEKHRVQRVHGFRV